MSKQITKEDFDGPQWMFDDLTLPRRAQRTNVFIAQTKDTVVMDEFKKYAANGKFEEMFTPKLDGKDVKYVSALIYNLQRNEIRDFKAEKAPVQEMDNPPKNLDEKLCTENTILIIEYVFQQEHANAISDWLAAWSQDQRLYNKRSTIIVFTSNVNLFNPTLRELCYSFSIPASSEAERWEIGKLTSKFLNASFKIKYGQELGLEMTQELVQASRGLNKQQVKVALQLGFFTRRAYSIDDFTSMKIDLVESHGMSYIAKPIGFDAVGGYDVYKTYLRQRLIYPLQQPDKAKYYGLSIPRGIIFKHCKSKKRVLQVGDSDGACGCLKMLNLLWTTRHGNQH
jgi:hypothetical protein